MSQLDQFLEITGCSSARTANSFLQKNKMDLNEAIIDYFNVGGSSKSSDKRIKSTKNDASLLDQIFSKYVHSSDSNTMDIEGSIAYFTDLNIDIENDVESIIAAYILESPSTGIFKRSSFVKNWVNVNVDVNTIKGMSKYLHNAITDIELMKNVYRFAFKYALEDGKRKLDLQDAISLWKVIYKPQFIQLEQNGIETTVTKFINDFLCAGKSGKESISKDEWDMAMSFFNIPLAELEQHTELAAWPVLMDDFADFLFGRG
jgi:DCN1-like protein 1/2